MTNKRLGKSFFTRDVLEIAPALLGKFLVRKFSDGKIRRYKIEETEAYRGEEDEACHACKGRTKRTEVMYHNGGKVYVYLIYGMYWMLNFVTGKKEHPQAVLVRGIEGFIGPGKVGKVLKLDKSFYAEELLESDRIWIEDSKEKISYKTDRRVGIDYAGSKWRNIKWRFILKSV